MTTAVALPLGSGPSRGERKSGCMQRGLYITNGKGGRRSKMLLRISQINVNGMNEEGKRREIINKFQKGKTDVLSV